jgi:hypothetical protein
MSTPISPKPVVRDSHRSTRLLTTRVPIPVAEAVDRLAEQAGMTRNAYVGAVVKAAVGGEK